MDGRQYGRGAESLACKKFTATGSDVAVTAVPAPTQSIVQRSDRDVFTAPQQEVGNDGTNMPTTQPDDSDDSDTSSEGDEVDPFQLKKLKEVVAWLASALNAPARDWQ